jgi:hypothetical protein
MQAFAAKETIETLIITEGQFKSWVACDNGLYCVGLTSISHFRNQETESIHPEIIEFIQACQVKKVVILWDGDCCNISTKDLLFKNDLSNRPNDFYKYAVKIRDEIKRFVKAKNFTIFFSTINSRKIYQEAKGIDDWFLGFKDPQDRVVVNEEFEKIGKLPGSLIYWEDITLDYGIKKIRAFFGLDFVNNFYQKHKNIIGNQSFLFFGNDYQIIKDLPVLQVSKDLKKFKRIGTNYYQLVDVPIPNGKKDDTIMEERLVPWEKSTIIDDHGKDSHKHIERFKGFTNIPSHTDYQPVIKGHWNLYYNINHQSKEGSWPTIKIFLQHLFEEQEENDMIYDYLTLLYRKPMLKLPIICLVSKEQGTGKSTFIYLLKLIFKQNLSIISSQELSGDFNAHWASSLIVACEETFLEKFETSEKIKNLSTGFETFRNEKNKTSSPIPNMLHFVFCSNHEDNFVKLDDEDSRYWIRKIQSRKQTIANFDQMLESEIPYFVNFLEKREITYKSDGDRLFFAPKDFDTKAKHNVIKDSEPVFIKDIKDSITEYFYRFDDVDTLLMTAENLKQYFSIKYSDRSAKNKINKQIREYLKVERWKSANGKEGPTTYSFYSTTQVDPEKKVKETYKGRPFVFKRENFISDEV